VRPLQNLSAAYLLAGCAAAYWVWLIWACAREWTHTEAYTYGWVVPFLALYFLWKRIEKGRMREAATRTPLVAGLAVAVLLAVAAMVAGIELLRLAPLYWRPVLWGVGISAFAFSVAAGYLIGGRELAGNLIFPCGFMLVAIPWPTGVEQATTLPMMYWVAQSVADFAPVLGIPARVSGTMIALPNCTIGIEEACSGIRSLQTALMVSLAYGEIKRLKVRWRAALVVAGVCFAVLGNLLRTLILVKAGASGGVEKIDHIHDLSGWLVLVLLLLVLWACAWLMGEVEGGSRKAGADWKRRKSHDSSFFDPDIPKAAFLTPFLAAGGFLLAHVWFLAHGADVARQRPVLASLRAEESENEVLAVPRSIAEILNPTTGVMLRRSDGGLAGTMAYHFFWSPSHTTAAALYHRPDVCMPGAGWEAVGEPKRIEVAVGGVRVPWTVFRFRRAGTNAFLIWGAWLNGKPVEIQFGRSMHLQREMLQRFVTDGTRTASFEAAAVLIPRGGETLPAPLAEEAARSFFKLSGDADPSRP
jgi:exosortase